MEFRTNNNNNRDQITPLPSSPSPSHHNQPPHLPLPLPPTQRQRRMCSRERSCRTAFTESDHHHHHHHHHQQNHHHQGGFCYGCNGTSESCNNFSSSSAPPVAPSVCSSWRDPPQQKFICGQCQSTLLSTSVGDRLKNNSNNNHHPSCPHKLMSDSSTAVSCNWCLSEVDASVHLNRSPVRCRSHKLLISSTALIIICLILLCVTVFGFMRIKEIQIQQRSKLSDARFPANLRFLQLEQRTIDIVEPEQAIFFQYFLEVRQNVSFEIIADGEFVVFGKKETMPSLSAYDFRWSLNQGHSAVSLWQELGAGNWYMMIVNHGTTTGSVDLTARATARNVTERTINRSAKSIPVDQKKSASKCVGEFCKRCPLGFNGRFCEIDNCHGKCNKHGLCLEDDNGIFSCRCDIGYKGKTCEKLKELNCTNGIDDDKDGLIDCNDPDCCTAMEECGDNEFCIYYSAEVATSGSTIRARYGFLLSEETGFQLAVDKTVFDEKRASLLVGVLFEEEGLPEAGVKIQVVNNNRFGYTHTDYDGRFYFMVNGGGTVILQMESSHGISRQVFINVGWNKIHTIDDVIMSQVHGRITSVVDQVGNTSTTVDDDSSMGLSYVFANPSSFQPISSYMSYSPGKQVFRFEVPIEGSLYSLVYNSDDQSVILISVLLTGQSIWADLSMISVQLSALGRFETRLFNAKPNLTFTSIWPRIDLFDSNWQGPFDLTVLIRYIRAKSRVTVQSKKVYSIPSAGIVKNRSILGNGWTLNVHHRYDHDSGVISTGLAEVRDSRSFVARSVYQHTRSGDIVRGVSMDNGQIVLIGSNRLYILKDKEVQSRKLDRFDSRALTGASADPTQQSVIHLLQASTGQIISLKVAFGRNVSSEDDIQLSPVDHKPNGALKGLIADKFGAMFYIEGLSIKYIDPLDRAIRILTSNGPGNGCNEGYTLDKANFNPVAIAINPLDNSIYVLESNRVWKLAHTCRLILGQFPDSCPHGDNIRRYPLDNAVDITFDNRGNIFILEQGKDTASRLKVLMSSGEGHILYGSRETIHTDEKKQWDVVRNQLKGIVEPIMSLIPHPSGTVMIIDAVGLLHLEETSAAIGNKSKTLTVSSGRSENYQFDNSGVHLSTTDSYTGDVIYNFTYSRKETMGTVLQSIGSEHDRLILTEDKKAHSLNMKLKSDFADPVDIQVSKDKHRRITEVVTGAGNRHRFRYNRKGLMTSLKSNDGTCVFDYDHFHKLSQVRCSSGSVNHHISGQYNSTRYCSKITDQTGSSSMVCTQQRTDADREWLLSHLLE